jgi:hypothetical protein
LVKKTLVVLFFTVSLYAAALDESIRALVDERQYEKHKTLIDLLFKNEQNFYVGERVDVIKVVKVLKENGLLELFYEQPTMTYLKFTANTKQTLFLKLINDTLQEMGFTYYFIDSVKYSGGKIEWSISYMGNYAVDPHLLASRLKIHDAHIDSIAKEANNKFEYVVNMHQAVYNVDRLVPEQRIEIPKAIDDIVLDVSLGKKVVVQPLAGSFWYPEVVLYDKNLNIIDVITDDSVRKTLYVNLTNQTHYISISDLYQLENLNGGLRVKLQGER